MLRRAHAQRQRHVRPESAPLPQSGPQVPAGTTRYDGGTEEGSRGPVKDYSKNSATSDVAPTPDTRYDGGPEEGTRGPGFSTD
jgi:hypothetical protein